MSVHYKFKSTLDYDTVLFDGLHISVADLKKAIFHQKRIGKNTDFDLQITNAQTKEDYKDDNALIAKNTSLIVARVPLTAAQKRIRDRNEVPTINNSIDQSSLGKSVDLTRLDGSEEDKIRAMISQSTQDYDPSKYVKIRGSNQIGEVPHNYRCHRCQKPGHWIKNCPLGGNQDQLEVKKSTGIPRSFMVPVEGPTVPGAMITPGGTYAVPAIDHQAYKEGKKERPPFSQDPQPVAEKPEIPEDMVCSICKDLLTDAVMIPCCGNSFCDDCIRTLLLESDEHECPDCNEKDVSPDTLIPNRYLRTAVSNFKNETGYIKRPVYRPPAQPAQPVVTAAIPESNASEKSAVISHTAAVTPTQTASLGVTTSAVEDIVPKTEDNITEGSEEVVTKLQGDEEAEVPPPPGTETAILPIRSSDHSWQDSGSETPRASEDEMYIQKKKRSYSRLRERYRNNMRSQSNRRSLSPAVHNNAPGGHQNDYSMQTKPYGQSGGDSRYHAPMHYDSGMRRSAEDRAGTPTVDEPHLHSQSSHMYPPGDDRVAQPPPPVPYSQPAPPPVMPDPYMAPPPRMPMYPPQPGYGPPPPPPPRYDGRPPMPYMAPCPPPLVGYRPPGPPRPYAPRPMRAGGYRGMQPIPPGLNKGLLNGTGSLDDPLEAFERMLREKDERDRRLGKHRSRRASRSRSRSYSRSPRSRSRSPIRTSRRAASPIGRAASRSRSPLPSKRRCLSRSPPPASTKHRNRSRTPKKRRSRSGSFSLSRSRSYSRSLSPRGSLPRERDRKGKRLRDAPAPYRSPARSPPRYLKERQRSREPYTASYYNESVAPTHDHYSSVSSTASSRDLRSGRYVNRVATAPLPSQLLPPPPNLIVAAAGPQVPQVNPATATTQDRKDYYDSYNRYPGAPAQFTKRFDDVAPPGTEGYYDLPPPGIDHPERPALNKDRPNSKDKDVDRYKDDRHRSDDKHRGRDRRDRDHDYEKDRHHRHDRRSADRKRSKRSSSPRYRDGKDSTPERSRKKDKDHDDKSDDRKKEKKIKEKKKKKDSDDKEKKKKKKKEKKAAALLQKEATAAVAAVTAAALLNSKPVRVKQEPKSIEDIKITEPRKVVSSLSVLFPPTAPVVVKTEPPETPPKVQKVVEPPKIKERTPTAPEEPAHTEPEMPTHIESEVFTPTEADEPTTTIDTMQEDQQPQEEEQEMEQPEQVSLSPKPVETEHVTAFTEPDSQVSEAEPMDNKSSDKDLLITNTSNESLYDGLVTEAEISTTTENQEVDDKEEGEIVDDKPEERESLKKDEFLAPVPELSKWEIDEAAEKLEESIDNGDGEMDISENGNGGKVTTEVIKRAENAIFQKAINAIRPIEIKKISDSRKVLYQNPEPKILDSEDRKSVNVTITVAKNERNVEITGEQVSKKKSERTKLKSAPASPSRISIKERLGEKVEDETKIPASKHIMMERSRDTSIKTDSLKNRSPRLRSKDRRISIADSPLLANPERKVYIEDRKKKKTEINRSRIVVKDAKMLERKAAERVARTPPPIVIKVQKDDSDNDRLSKKDKKSLDKKRKKEHRSRSKSRERKKRKDKKHKKERLSERRTKHTGKNKDSSKDKSIDREKETSTTPSSAPKGPTIIASSAIASIDKKSRRNARLVSDRKRSIDEANFEPDYSASDSETDNKSSKRGNIDDEIIDVDAMPTSKKKRPKLSTSEDESSSSESSSSESDSSVESHRKKKKKHNKKRKKRKSRRDSSSDSDAYSDSSDSSSEEEKHRKKKKFKNKSKKTNKKKKSKNK